MSGSRKGTITANRKIFNALCEYCWWLHNVRSVLGVMCNYDYIGESVSSHARIIILSMQEYYFVQVCKLFDPKQSRTRRGAVNNLVLDRVIEDFGFSNDVVAKLTQLKQEMTPLYSSLKEFRNKLGAHSSLRHSVHRKTRRLGKYRQADEQVFFKSLLEFLRVADAALDPQGVSGLEWVDSFRIDAEIFMKILVDAKKAKLDPQMVSI